MMAAAIPQTVRSELKARVFDSAGVLYVMENAPYPERATREMIATVRVLLGEQIKIENPATYRTPGVVYIYALTPPGMGTDAAEALALDVETAFRGQTFNGVVYRAPSPKNMGVVDGKHQIVIEMAFHADDVS